MNELELKELQKELDEEKYISSEGSGFDRSGNMDWCDNCLFQNRAYKTCDLRHESRTANMVCARHKSREEKNGVEKSNRTTKSNRPRQSKSKRPNL